MFHIKNCTTTSSSGDLPTGVLIISWEMFEQSLCRPGFRAFELRFRKFNEPKHALRGLKPSSSETLVPVTLFSDKLALINGIRREREERKKEK